MKRVTDYAVYLVVRLGLAVLGMLSLEQCHGLARGLAALFGGVLRIRRQLIEKNLKQAFPDMPGDQRRRVARAMWEHLFLMVAETVHAPRKLRPSTWKRHIHFHRDDEMVRILLDPRATILVSGHYGNFELAGFILGLFDFPTYAIARTMDNFYLQKFFSGFRAKTSRQYMIPKDNSATLIAVLLQRGAALGVLGDQAAGPKGCWVDFFGRPASTHKAIALFSLSHDAPLLVTYTRRTGGPLQYEAGMAAVADPADPQYNLTTVPELTQWYSKRLEELIRAAPEQYWWLHRRWKGKPGTGRKKPRTKQAA